MRTTILFAVILFPCCLRAQMGIGTLSPDQRSVLELQCSPGKGRGLLIPRMSKLTRRGMELGAGDAGADSVGLALSAVHNGLMLYDNTQNLFYGYEPSMPPVSIPANYSIAGRDEAKNRVWQILNPWKTQYAWNGDDLLVNLIQDINTTGFVGIGWVDYTESPIYPLHVKGDGYFENSNLTVDKTISTTTIKADTVGEDEKTFLFGYGSVPIGTVLPWSGEWDSDIEAIMNQKGWVLCDERGIKYTDLKGRDKTVPDLRGRFIVGYDSKKQDTDYDAVGKYGPEYGKVHNVSRETFYKLEDGGKRVRLLKPAMPKHNHRFTTRVEIPRISVENWGRNWCLNVGNHDRALSNYKIEYGVECRTKQPAAEGFSFAKREKGQGGQEVTADGIDVRCGNEERDDAKANCHGYKQQSYYVFQTTNNYTLSEGGYYFSSNNQSHNAMAIENRPPYYVLAYIIRVK